MTTDNNTKVRLNALMAAMRIGHEIPRGCIYVAEDDDGGEGGPTLWLEMINPCNHGERLSLYPNPGFFVVEHVKYDRDRNAFVGQFRHNLTDSELYSHLGIVWRRWKQSSLSAASER